MTTRLELLRKKFANGAARLNVERLIQRVFGKFHAAEKIFSSRRVEETAEIFYRLRYVLGGIFFLLCVISEVHGSSISIYAHIFGHRELDAVLLGHSRPIRSDEWLVFTPFAFAQYFTNFALISDIVRAAPTNMFMIYGQAVEHLAMIFRPAQLGYMFLDQGSGLAFFWVSRLVVLFLISFEFAQKILSAKRSVSLLYAVMVTFSPLAQWWWAVNFIAEILAAGQGVVVCWKMYFDLQTSRKRFLAAAGFLWCAGIYILSMYPAWQVPFGWTFLLCMIAATVASDNVSQVLRRDKIFWLVGVIVMLAPICHVLYISRDVIEVIRATEYPGSRFVLGGGFPMMIHMLYGVSAVLPFHSIDPTGITNDCEAATFFSAAPFGLIIFALVTIRRRQFDLLMTSLVVLSGVIAFWEAIGFPAWLAKISMMGMTTDNRARIVLDFAQMLILFRGLSLIELNFSRVEKIFTAGAISIVGAIFVYRFVPDWLGAKTFLALTAFNFAAIYLFAGRLTNLRVGILIVMMLLIGATINPIAHGVDVIYKLPVGQKISEIVARDKSNWLVEDDSIVRNSLPIMFGAPTVNCTNTYPVLDRWRKLDPTGKDFKLYNRYAHIEIIFDSGATNFDIHLDKTILTLNPADLPKLDVRYILSPHGDLEKFSTAAVKINKLFADAGTFIYKVN